MKLNLLPSETFTIQTQDSIDIVRQKLLAQVENSSTLQSSQDLAIFKGQVNECGFKLFKISNFFRYDNSLVTIVGSFANESDKTTIHIVARSHVFANFYYGTIFSLTLTAFIIYAISLISSYRATEELINSYSRILLLFIVLMLCINTFNQHSKNEIRYIKKKMNQIFLVQD